MGRNISNAPSTTLTATGIAGEALVSGDLVVLSGTDGKLYAAATPGTSAATDRPLSQAAAATGSYPTNTDFSSTLSGNFGAAVGLAAGGFIVAGQNSFAVLKSDGTESLISSYASSLQRLGRGVAQLPNGNFVIAGFTSNSSTSGTLAIDVYSPAGAVLYSVSSAFSGRTSPSSMSDYALCVKVVPLSNGNFAVVAPMGTSAGSDVRMCYGIYSPTLSVVSAFKTATNYYSVGNISPWSYGPTRMLDAAQLGNGNILAAYGGVSGQYIRYEIFSSTGTYVGGGTVAYPSSYSPSVSICVVGNNAVLFCTANTSAIQFNEINGSTAAVDRYGYLYCPSGNTNGYMVTNSVRLSSGLVVVGAWDSSSAGPVATYLVPFIYGSTAAGSSMNTSYRISEGSWAQGMTDGLFGIGDSVFYIPQNNTSLGLARVDCSATGFSGSLSYVGTGKPIYYACAAVSATNYPNQPKILIASYNTRSLATPVQLAVSPVGVATAAASTNASVPYQYQGVASIKTAVAYPVAVDTQSATPPGQRMNIIGSAATLYGIQASTGSKRNIN